MGVRAELNDWLTAAAIDRGRLFRRVNKVGRTWGDGLTVKAVWHIVKESARNIGVAQLAPHDLARAFVSTGLLWATPSFVFGQPEPSRNRWGFWPGRLRCGGSCLHSHRQ